MATILSEQPKGVLSIREELAGWLANMERYSGATDRPFWLEAHGGRSYAIERQSKAPVAVERLSVGVVGGIQADRLASLLIKTDDDGLLARFMPIWPEPTAARRPARFLDETVVEAAFRKLHGLDLASTNDDHFVPVNVQFTNAAAEGLNRFREAMREVENGEAGLMLSLMIETNDEWAVARRYMGLASPARVNDADHVRLPAVAA